MVYPDWSLWKLGEGKTSVLNFLELQQRDVGNVVIKYSPWGVSSESDLWIEFSECLLDGLKKNNVKVGLLYKGVYYFSKFIGWVKKIVSCVISFFIKNDKDAVEVISDFFSSVITKKLKLNKSFIKDVVSNLGDVKVLIFIDDLDRVDPNIIPKLLLVLRELLDFQRFVYVLAFDREIVSTSLKNYNQAWSKSNANFLDKIIDFSFELPHPTLSQATSLALTQFNALAPFVPKEAIEDLKEFLPKNPRKLKLFARLVGSTSKEVLRHAEGELDWPIILLFALLRTENESFVNDFIYRIVDTGKFNWYNWKISASSGAGDDEQKKEILELIGRYGDLKVQEERIFKLIDALRERSANNSIEQLKYQASFALSPHSITWGEFKSFFKDWRTSKSNKVVEHFIALIVKSSQNPKEKVLAEFYSTIVNYYALLLEGASNVVSDSDHDKLTSELEDLLGLFGKCFINSLEPLDDNTLVSYWSSIYKVFIQWRHFNANRGDLRLRELELAFLINFSERIQNKLSIYEKLEPWGIEDFPLFDERSHGAKKEFVGKILSSLEDFVVIQAHDFIKTPKEIKKIRSDESYLAMRFLLTSPSSPCFSESNIDKTLAALVSRRGTSNAREDALDFMDVLLRGLSPGSLAFSVGVEEYRQFIAQNSRFIVELWSLAISAPSQYRFLSSLRDRRQKFLDAGVHAEDLNQPDWLINEI